MALHPRPKKPQVGRRRTVEQMDRDAKALALYCDGKSYPQIAEACGWKNRASAFEAVKRAAADRAKMALDGEDTYQALIAQIHADIARCTDIINRDHVSVTASGKVATMRDPDTGLDVPVLDDGPKLRAITELRHLRDQLIMLKDLKPAAKTRVEVVTDDVVQREIDQLTKELAKAAKNDPVPSE